MILSSEELSEELDELSEMSSDDLIFLVGGGGACGLAKNNYSVIGMTLEVTQIYIYTKLLVDRPAPI